MPRKRKPPLTFVERMKKLYAAQIADNRTIVTAEHSDEEIGSLDSRVRKILGFTEERKRRGENMLFFVMYDIESNKVRALVRKYLIRKGCVRIQDSVFLADTSVGVYESIKNDLSVVQQTYDNDDSIIILPISTDYIRMMKIIGQKIDVDVITHSKNTLFF